MVSFWSGFQDKHLLDTFLSFPVVWSMLPERKTTVKPPNRITLSSNEGELPGLYLKQNYRRKVKLHLD